MNQDGNIELFSRRWGKGGLSHFEHDRRDDPFGRRRFPIFDELDPLVTAKVFRFSNTVIAERVVRRPTRGTKSFLHPVA